MDFVKQYWDEQAIKHGSSYKASWEDIYMQELEYNNLHKHILETDSVLDVGCSNGYFLNKINAQNRVGVDLSEKMIGQAKSSYNLHFEVGDIRNLRFKDNSFDVVYTIRCLISLLTWEDQICAINECLRIARRKVIFSEAFYEPLQRLNAIRQVAGLPILEEHDFNRYLKEYKLNKLLYGMDYEVNNFSSVYYLGTRFLRELISDHMSYTNPIAENFLDLSYKYSGGDFGIQKMYIITL